MATIRDVARLAGVGVATASRVISGKGPFSADAAARVDGAIEQLGFRPSTIARALSLKSTETIGVCVPDYGGPFYGPMLNAIAAELAEQGRHMLATSGDADEPPRERALSGVQSLVDRQCDGIILSTNSLRDADILELKRRQPRLVLVNRDLKGSKAHCFTVDHKLGGRLAARALLEHGHRKIAVISGLQNAADNRQRLRGFLDELEEAGIDRAHVTIADADFTAQGGWRATELLLQRGPRVTALFCCNDQMAMGAMSCLQASGKSVPGDVSVVGYDDADIAPFLSPRLTTVHIAITTMGRNASRMLLNLAYGTSLPVEHEFPPTLVVRESLGRARK